MSVRRPHGVALKRVTVVSGGGRRLLSEIDLQVAAGEFVAIISERPSESVAMLSVIGGTRAPRLGWVRKHSGRTRIAYDLEALLPELTVAQNLEIGVSAGGRNRRGRRHELLQGLGLSELLGTPVGELTSSQCSALCLVRGLVRDAECYGISYCLDSLETRSRTFARAWLRKSSDLGKTVLLATQDEELACIAADRVIVLRNGEITLDAKAVDSSIELVRTLQVNSVSKMDLIMRESIWLHSHTSVDPLHLATEAFRFLAHYSNQNPCLVALKGSEFPLQISLWPGTPIQQEEAVRVVEAYLETGTSPPELVFREVTTDDYTLFFAYRQAAWSLLPPERIFGELESAAMQQLELRSTRQLLEHVGRLDTIGRLAGGVAHDVNNSLGSILVSIDMLTFMDGLSPDARKHLEVIRSSAERINQLTRHLVEFSRKGNLRLESIDLVAVLQGCLTLIRSTLDKRIHLSMGIDCIQARILGDEKQIENAIINLAMNAMDAIEGEGRLVLQLDTQDNMVVLTVSDTGSGMPPEVRRRAFEPFFSTKGPKGTGLGLASVEGIISEHDGTIRIVRSDDRGTVFKVEFPMEDGPAEEPDLPTREQPQQGLGQIVLVANIDNLVRRDIVGLLEKMGYPTLAASGPEEALSLFRQHHSEIGVVFLDIVMPKMSGIDCVEALRTINPQVRVVFCSRNPPTNLSGVREHGLVRLLRKPIRAGELAAVLEVTLRNPRLDPEAA